MQKRNRKVIDSSIVLQHKDLCLDTIVVLTSYYPIPDESAVKFYGALLNEREG